MSTKRRRLRPIPQPPPAAAEALSKTDVAGLLRVRVRQVDEWRRSDATFPQPHVLSNGTARWSREDVRAWFLRKPLGYCTTGGRRGAGGEGSVHRDEGCSAEAS